MHTLYTYGYLGNRVEDLRERAERLDALVADIRHKPWSRNPAFIKKRLAEVLGDRYAHWPEFGNKNYRGRFGEGIMLVDEAEGLRRLEATLQARPVVLLCACRDVESCHRTFVARRAAAALGVGYEHL